MHFVFLSAIKDLRRMRREPLALATWIGTPLIVSLLLVAFFGHEQPKPQGLVMIADQDKTFLSALVLHAYTQDKLGEMFTVQLVPLEEGRRRINSGDGSALVIIPKGFSQTVLGRNTAKMQLITNPSQSILPGIVESVTSLLVEGVWRVQQFTGDDLNQFSSDREPSDADIAASSARFRSLFTGMRKYLDPPVIKVDVEVVETNPGRRQIDMSAAMFPSMTFLAVLFLAFGMTSDLWKEKGFGTLRHVAVTPGSVAGFLAGKVLAIWIIFALVGSVSLLCGKFLIRAEIHGALLGVLWITAFGGAMYILLVLVNTFFQSQRGATMLSNLLVMTLSMLGAGFFPFEIMPGSLAKIGRWMPNGWALLRYRDILSGQASPAGLAAAFGGVLAVTALLFAIAARRLRWKFAI
jgi:ABC-type multidrug transport system permease subunit